MEPAIIVFWLAKSQRGSGESGYVSWQRMSEDCYIAENFRMKVANELFYTFFSWPERVDMDVLMEVKDIQMSVEVAEETETCNCMSILKYTKMEGLGKCMTFLSGTTQVRIGIGNGRKDWQNKHKFSRNRRYHRNPDHIKTGKNRL